MCAVGAIWRDKATANVFCLPCIISRLPSSIRPPDAICNRQSHQLTASTIAISNISGTGVGGGGDVKGSNAPSPPRITVDEERVSKSGKASCRKICFQDTLKHHGSPRNGRSTTCGTRAIPNTCLCQNNCREHS